MVGKPRSFYATDDEWDPFASTCADKGVKPGTILRRFVKRAGSQDSNNQHSTLNLNNNHDNEQSKTGSKPLTGMYANPSSLNTFENAEDQTFKDIDQMNIQIDSFNDLIVEPEVIKKKEELKNHYRNLAEEVKRPERMNDNAWKAKHIPYVLEYFGVEEGNKWLMDNFNLSPEAFQQYKTKVKYV